MSSWLITASARGGHGRGSLSVARWPSGASLVHATVVPQGQAGRADSRRPLLHTPVRRSSGWMVAEQRVRLAVVAPLAMVAVTRKGGREDVAPPSLPNLPRNDE